MSEQRSYLNTNIINKNRSKAMAQLIIGITLTVFYSFAFISMAEGDYPVKNTPLILVLMVPTIYLIWCGVQNKKYVRLAEEYNKIFASDNDGFVTALEMEKKTKKKYFDIFLELEILFSRGYFTNCSLQQGRNPRVIINDALVTDQSGVGFVQMKCPKCGGFTRIRAGQKGKCEFCGSDIKNQ